MRAERLEWHLHNWADYMRQPAHRLGYPARSPGIHTGGASSADAFDLLCDEMDVRVAQQMDALIDSLPRDQRMAVNARYLHTRCDLPNRQRLLDAAMDMLCIMADARGMV